MKTVKEFSDFVLEDEKSVLEKITWMEKHFDISSQDVITMIRQLIILTPTTFSAICEYFKKIEESGFLLEGDFCRHIEFIEKLSLSGSMGSKAAASRAAAFFIKQENEITSIIAKIKEARSKYMIETGKEPDYIFISDAMYEKLKKEIAENLRITGRPSKFAGIGMDGIGLARYAGNKCDIFCGMRCGLI